MAYIAIIIFQVNAAEERNDPMHIPFGTSKYNDVKHDAIKWQGNMYQYISSTGDRSGAHPAYYTMGTGSSFPGVKQPGHEADHSPPTSVKVKKSWINTSPPSYSLIL
jgi:hypothetical protein